MKAPRTIASMAFLLLTAACGGGAGPGTKNAVPGSTGPAASSSAAAKDVSVDSLTCDAFPSADLDAALGTVAAGRTLVEVKVKEQGGGRLDCEAFYPPQSSAAPASEVSGVSISVMDGYYDEGGYVPASARDRVQADFLKEKERRAGETFATDAPYRDVLTEAPDFGADSYYQDTLYRDSADGQAGAIRSELFVLREKLPFVVVVNITRPNTKAQGDEFSMAEFRHTAVAELTKVVITKVEAALQNPTAVSPSAAPGSSALPFGLTKGHAQVTVSGSTTDSMELDESAPSSGQIVGDTGQGPGYTIFKDGSSILLRFPPKADVNSLLTSGSLLMPVDVEVVLAKSDLRFASGSSEGDCTVTLTKVGTGELAGTVSCKGLKDNNGSGSADIAGSFELTR